MRVLLAVLMAVCLTGCATGVRSAAPGVAIRVFEDENRYGSLDFAPLKVVRGEPAELTGTVLTSGEPAPAGTPYYVTIGFTGPPHPVNALDSTGATHASLAVAEPGALRPCAAVCLVYVLPPNTRLIGLEQADMS